jgi:Co/Zn/Cd efflux system component
VIAEVGLNAIRGTVPAAEVMGIVGVTAMLANITVAAMLYRYREGDSNMRSVWLCTRNDVLGNLAVLIAASFVYFAESPWPDIAVAVIMAGLALSGAFQVTRQALAERRSCT